MEHSLKAISKFMAFFFALTLSVVVVIVSYALLGAASASQTWEAVRGLILSAIILLALSLVASSVGSHIKRTTSESGAAR